MKKQLADGLILRSLSEGHASDAENLPQFYADVFGDAGDDDAHLLPAWTRDLMSEEHPTMSLDDLWVVVDPSQAGRIVSALLLIPQQWRYENIEFGVGRVELVATHKDYRRRGLIRALMDTAHERSAASGHLLQAITGIPHYYRQFGYGFAIDHGAGSILQLVHVPKLKEGQKPSYVLRPMTVDDIPDVLRWDAAYAETCAVSHVQTEVIWRYEIDGRDPGSFFHGHPFIIVNIDGEGVGYVKLHTGQVHSHLSLWNYVVGEKASYLETFDDVMRAIQKFGEEWYQGKEQPTRILFEAGLHPTINVLLKRMSGGTVRERVYAWFIRVPDLPAFIRHIAPVLERRLEGSGAQGYTGELRISFYDMTGLTLRFEQGKIADVTVGVMTQEKAQAAFPYDSFLNVLFGHRTVDEISYVLPEIYARRDANVLLEIFFPKKQSYVIALG